MDASWWRDVTQRCGFWDSRSGGGTHHPHPHSHFPFPSRTHLMASAVWICSQGPARGGPAGTEDQEAQPPQALSVPRLQRKLKEAARKILRLHLEKEQLLELGNRLRAELGHLTGGSHPPPPHRPSIACAVWLGMLATEEPRWGDRKRARGRRAGQAGGAGGGGGLEGRTEPPCGVARSGVRHRAWLHLCSGSSVNPLLWQHL